MKQPVDVSNIPIASSAVICKCDGQACGRPHLILEDVNGTPFAQVVLPESIVRALAIFDGLCQ